jgi:predicted dehydrogenase
MLPMRGGKPSDVDDWVAMLAEFGEENPVTGVLESTKLATAIGEGHGGQDVVEVNGSDGTIVYSTQTPLQLRVGHRRDKELKPIAVPREFLVWPGSRRDPDVGDPLATFRYDQNFEFVDAIRQGRACRPTLWDGVKVQAVMDAAVISVSQRRWVDVADVG